MEVYQVMDKSVQIPAGTVLQLSSAQVSGRAHQLKPLPEQGWFEALEPLTFKAGHVLTFREPLDPATLQALLPPEMARPVFKRPDGCHQLN